MPLNQKIAMAIVALSSMSTLAGATELSPSYRRTAH
jgi:hypothetical protein